MVERPEWVSIRYMQTGLLCKPIMLVLMRFIEHLWAQGLSWRRHAESSAVWGAT